MQNTLDLAITQAQKNGAAKIDCITMKVGELSGVIPEALEFAFEILVQGTIAEDAQLEIETVRVVCYCRQCDYSFKPHDYVYQCPQCQQISTNIISGRELQLDSLMVSG